MVSSMKKKSSISPKRINSAACSGQWLTSRMANNSLSTISSVHMKWLSISLLMLCLVACRSKQTTVSEQKVESMQLHGAQGIVQLDYFCSDSTPLLLTLDSINSMHSFRNLAKAKPKANHRGYPHHERLILSTYTTDTQRVSSSQSQEKVVVTKDRKFSFSYDFVVMVILVLSVGLLLKSLR